jgi:hypothetical protein
MESGEYKMKTHFVLRFSTLLILVLNLFGDGMPAALASQSQSIRSSQPAVNRTVLQADAAIRTIVFHVDGSASGQAVADFLNLNGFDA